MCGFVRPKMTPEHQMCWQKVYILSHKISSLDQNRCRNLQCVLFSSLSLYLLKKGTCLYYLETYPLKLDGFVRSQMPIMIICHQNTFILFKTSSMDQKTGARDCHVFCSLLSQDVIYFCCLKKEERRPMALSAKIRL